MNPFTSKELYIINGGQKIHIYRDGFGDVYNATAEEETQWAKEVVEIALHKLATEEDPTTLQSAMENLQYHQYEELQTVLLKVITSASPAKKIALTAILYKMSQYDKSLETILDTLKQYGHD